MATKKIEVLLEVGRFDVDGGVEMTMIQAHINVPKQDSEDLNHEFSACQIIS